ncbi:MAG: hypothetical protein HQL70_00650 [Magnetococcales bacterium]|nr:hypothetical protein [Magnetococcales bacterium]
MLNNTIDSSILNQIAPAFRVDPVSNSFKKWKKFSTIVVKQDTFSMVLGQVERKLQEEDGDGSMTPERGFTYH